MPVASSRLIGAVVTMDFGSGTSFRVVTTDGSRGGSSGREGDVFVSGFGVGSFPGVACSVLLAGFAGDVDSRSFQISYAVAMVMATNRILTGRTHHGFLLGCTDMAAG